MGPLDGGRGISVRRLATHCGSALIYAKEEKPTREESGSAEGPLNRNGFGCLFDVLFNIGVETFVAL